MKEQITPEMAYQSAKEALREIESIKLSIAEQQKNADNLLKATNALLELVKELSQSVMRENRYKEAFGSAFHELTQEN